jgi:hypothetical protein
MSSPARKQDNALRLVTPRSHVDRFSTVRKAARHDNRLPAQARLLFEDVCDLSQRDGFCNAGQDHFAKRYGASDRSVRNWEHKLEELGYLSIERGEGNDGRRRRLVPASRPPVPTPSTGNQLPVDTGNELPKNPEIPENQRQTPRVYISPRAAAARAGAGAPAREDAGEAGDGEAGDAAAAFLISDLEERGVDAPVAERLVRDHPDRVPDLLRRFDVERAAGNAHGPGWLVRAIEQGWSATTANGRSRRKRSTDGPAAATPPAHKPPPEPTAEERLREQEERRRRQERAATLDAAIEALDEQEREELRREAAEQVQPGLSAALGNPGHPSRNLVTDTVLRPVMRDLITDPSRSEPTHQPLTEHVSP